MIKQYVRMNLLPVMEKLGEECTTGNTAHGPYCVEHRRRKGSFMWQNNAGRPHKDGHYCHWLAESLHYLDQVETIPRPGRRQLTSPKTREGQQAQTADQHPAAIHP